MVIVVTARRETEGTTIPAVAVVDNWSTFQGFQHSVEMKVILANCQQLPVRMINLKPIPVTHTDRLTDFQD